MSSNPPSLSYDLKSVLLNSSKPLLLKNFLSDWPPLTWTLSKWFKLFENELTFRSGNRSCSVEPQWESSCKFKKLTPELFLEMENNPDFEEWFYFDYKHLAEYAQNNSKWGELIVPWKYFGFPEQNIEQTTIWIGNEKAHTPCHVDTYGCNLIAQVIGRKQWILFHPKDKEMSINQTRVPYEESSIYSKVNLFCGKNIIDSNIRYSCPYVVTLEPGDVLFVPNRWWHYVENLSLGLSLNTWIPLKSFDRNAYLDESLVRYMVARFSEQLSYNERQKLLNPNEIAQLENVNEGLQLMRNTYNLYKDQLSALSFTPESQPLSLEDMNSKLHKSHQSVIELKQYTEDDFHQFAMEKCQCNHINNDKEKQISQVLNCPKRLKLSDDMESPESINISSVAKKPNESEDSVKTCPKPNNQMVDTCQLINAFSHPDVIALVRQKLIELN